MTDLTTVNRQLPTTIEDLAKFVLIGRDRMAAVRAEISAINRLGLAQEVRQQKLAEAQDIAEVVLDAEVKMGELIASMPTATKGNQYTGKMVSNNAVTNQTPKEQALREIGFDKMRANRLETLARYPEVVAQAKIEAREQDDIVSRSFVLEKINPKPHVSFNSGENEWYTPPEIIEAAREAMGSIDLDPASCSIANETVQAAEYFDLVTNGLNQKWHGNVWLNPPYASDLIGKFCDKVVQSFRDGDIEQAIILVNNATETNWFYTLISAASAVVFTKGRIKFRMNNGSTGAPLQGQALIYMGDNPTLFTLNFLEFGWGATL